MYSFFRIAAALCLALAAALFGSQPALAGGFNDIIVTTTSDGLNEFDGQCSLREAIHNVRLGLAFSPLPGECAAGSTTATNRVVLSSGASYPLTVPADVPGGGALIFEPTWQSDQLQLRIETDGAERASIVQTVLGAGVFISASARTELENLVISGGSLGAESTGGAGIVNAFGHLRLQSVEVSGNSAFGFGGGILNAMIGDLVLVDSSVELNGANQGGGIYNAVDSRLELHNSRLRANSASQGGGIYNAGELYVGPGSSLNLNLAFIASDFAGGAIYNAGSASLDIVGASFEGNRASERGGGAIAARNGPLFRIVDSEFIGNSSGPDQKMLGTSDSLDVRGSGGIERSGGAISLFSGDGPFHLQIERSVFHDNRSAGGGGAILSNGNGLVEIFSSEFVDNRGQISFGGAIWAGGHDLHIANSLFDGNTARVSGGAVTSSGSTLIEHSRFTGNGPVTPEASLTGGALALGGNLQENSVRFSRFEDNGANRGGAVAVRFGTSAVLVNNIFTGNIAQNEGGALFVDNADVQFANSTVSSNAAGEGGGIYVGPDGDVTGTNLSIVGNLTGQDIVKRGTMRLQNSLIVTPDQDNCVTDIGNPLFISLGNNISNDDSCPGLDGPGDLVNTDPLVDFTLVDIGGNTLVHRLLPGSPAIDAGNDAACQASPVDGVDQRGGTRPITGCDIGALEQEFIFDRIFRDRFEFPQ